jgi:ribosomal protein S18 acetylase RimI-like enzyme
MTGVAAIRRAGPADARVVVDVLCQAFDADPVINWVVRQDGGRAGAFNWLFTVALDLVLPHGHVHLTEDGRGTALWAPPGRWGVGWVREFGRLPGFARAVGVRRLGRVARAVAMLEAKHPRRPHYYLAELAVLPPFQGRGVGSALLRHQLAVCDGEGVPAYLENSNPRNTALYISHGFRVVERHLMGGDGPPLWLMWRDPAGTI